MSYLDTDKFNLSQSRLMGQQKAQVDIWYRHYTRIYEANPDQMGDEFLKIWEQSLDIMNTCDPIGWAITINPGNVQVIDDREQEVLKEFISDFVEPFQKSLSRKSTIIDYSFTIEESSTRRLHLHGVLKRKKSKFRVYPSEIHQQIWMSLPEQFKNQMNKKHIVVEPLYNNIGWENYCSKNPLFSFSK